MGVGLVDTDARWHTPAAMFDSGAVKKKRVYRLAVEDRRGNFTPFVQSVDGLLQHEASHFINIFLLVWLPNGNNLSLKF